MFNLQISQPQKVDMEKKTNEAVEKIYGAVEDATDVGKEEVKERVYEAKHSVSSFIKHGLSKGEKLAKSAREYADNKGVSVNISKGDKLAQSAKEGRGGVNIEATIRVPDSWSSFLKDGDQNQSKNEEAVMPVSKKNGGVSSMTADFVSSIADSAARSTQLAIDGKKQEVKGKVKEAKHVVSSMAIKGLSKTEDAVHSAKEYLENRKAAKNQTKTIQVSDQAETEEAAVGSTATPGTAGNQPFMNGTVHTQTSWKNCCGLFDCLTSSDR